MRLIAAKLKNFRGYGGEIEIPIDPDLTAFIGRNDAGKSSVLEALAIFFDYPLVKFEPEDRCVHTEDKEVSIGGVFTDLPQSLTLDAQSSTDMETEYLVNRDGQLEIHKVFDCSAKSPKPRIIARAWHPTANQYSDLLQLKNTDLKKRLKELGVEPEGVDQRSNPSLRRAIWNSCEDLELAEQDIELNKEDAKRIWDQIQNHLPIFTLFRADRASTDEDAEVQDPMKLAVRQAVSELSHELREIQDKVQVAAMNVASRTLEKLQEFDPALAKELSPVFRAEPKWDGLFKLALETENQIPVNKRGSGVRRLILLGFFRAEAERRRLEEGKTNIIYAIEEPETSQHPSNQQAVVEALKDLASTEGCQVILTTHVPGLAELIGIDGLRYVHVPQDHTRAIDLGADEVLERIADELGVIPDHRVRVFVCVEGPNDIAFLKGMANVLQSVGDECAIDPESPEIAFLPLGGSTLRDWVNAHYLKPIGRPEIHIYDRGDQPPYKYQGQAASVNAREDGSCAFLTSKAEAENYLHPEAIREVFDLEVEVTDDNDVPVEVARAVHGAADNAVPWEGLGEEKKKKKEGRAKHRLNSEVVARMTMERLAERGGLEEVRGWLRAIKQRSQ